MKAGKQGLIAAGFAVLRTTRLHTLFGPLTRGCGAILMLHRVRPWGAGAFTPNRLLEIEPAFLEAALSRIAALGFDFVDLDEALRRLGEKRAKPFVALTFDDGYRDTVEHALPILENHAAPFTVFVTTGFAQREARLWWVELEEAVAALDHIDVAVDQRRVTMASASAAEKEAAFATLYWILRDGPEERLLSVIATLLDQAGLASAFIVDALCLDWTGIEALSKHPLCTIGVHTVSHPMLAKHGEDAVRHELLESRRLIEARCGLEARHLAYPVGDRTSAGRREFTIARELGFTSAVTTRPGMLWPAHRDHRLALPRLSVNGNWQTLESLEVLLSGVPFALWNKGRRIDVD